MSLSLQQLYLQPTVLEPLPLHKIKKHNNHTIMITIILSLPAATHPREEGESDTVNKREKMPQFEKGFTELNFQCCVLVC